VLSTTGTYKFGIYEKPLLSSGFDVIKPPIEMQEKQIHPAIYNPVYGIKSHSNPIHPQARENLMNGITFLKDNGAQVIILGCTEIPLAITDKKIDGVVNIDPANILARALINIINPDKLKSFKN
jgi:aspartate racemase